MLRALNLLLALSGVASAVRLESGGGAMPALASYPAANIVLGNPTSELITSPELEWLRQESYRLAELRVNTKQLLKERGISMDREPGPSLASRHIPWRPRVVLSSNDNSIYCRVGLDRVPIGRKAIAPCRCKGTNEWISFSTFNALRRRNPTQWEGPCRTCLSKYDLTPVYEHGGLGGNLLSALLDHPGALRGVAGIALLGTFRAVWAVDLLKAFLTSGWLWSKYPSWADIVHLPLPLRLLAVRYLAGRLGGSLLGAEAAAREALADLETRIVEPRLPTIN